MPGGKRFAAEWDSASEQWTRGRIRRLFDIVTGAVLLRLIVGAFVVPSQSWVLRLWSKITGSYPLGDSEEWEGTDLTLRFGTAERIEIETADGETLDAVLCRCLLNSGTPQAESGPTVVLLNPNFALWQYRLAEIDGLLAAGVNVVGVNYRGTGLSTGRLTRDGLILDALAAKQIVTRCLGVPRDKVAVFGRSLGGAVAVLASEKGAVLCADRTFTSLADVAVLHARICVSIVCGWDFLLYSIVPKLIRLLLWFSAWEMSPGAKWREGGVSRWTVSCEDDAVIPRDAQLQWPGGIQLRPGFGDSHNRGLLRNESEFQVERLREALHLN
eukprot:Hpha_TRINITY_DN20847_c0_g1::TRINITY_DN20847_c0_g1_i1::g.85692::m.85692/K06889/K06889; uncharacterized protein